MTNYKYNFLIIFLCIAINAQSQKTTKNTAILIPFQLTSYNYIVIQAVVNNRDTLNLMLHTAANGVTLTEDATKRMNIRFNNQLDSVKSWGGSNNTSNYSEGNTITIGALTKNNIIIWDDKNSGQETDGKIGLDFFGDKIIEIDYDKKELIVMDRLPKKLNGYKKFRTIKNDNNLFMNGICKINRYSFPNNFLIHSGYAGCILLDDEFVQKNEVGGKVEIIGEKKLKDAFGNVLTTKKGIIPQFQLGSFKLEKIPVVFFTGAIGRQKMSILGADILKRFNWIIDKKEKTVYIKPNKLFPTEYLKI